MKKIFKILAILAIVGLLFVTGVAINNNDYSEVSYKNFIYGSIDMVEAGPPCEPPSPGYPNNCE